MGCKKEKPTHYHCEDLDFPKMDITINQSLEDISKEDYIEGTVEICGAGDDNKHEHSMQIRGRGNSTWMFPKKPYQIKFNKKEEVLGMPKDRRWVLLANYSDKSMLRTEMGFELGRMSNLDWVPESRFVELFINDDYQGTYQVTQKVEESSNRVNIGDHGFLLEVDQIERLGADDVYFETDNFLFNIKEPKLNFGDEKYNYIKEYITKTEEVLLGDDCFDPEEGYLKYIDRDALIDWYLINEITRNNDAAFVTSVYMSLVPGEKIKMGPIWDFDISLGNINYNGNEATDGFWMKDTKWLEPLFENEEFLEALKERFNFFYNHRGEVEAHIISKSELLKHSKNYDKWPTLGEYVWPNYVYFDTYEEEVNYLLSWFNDRMEWLNVAINEL